MTAPMIGRPEHRGGLWSKVKTGDGHVHDGAWRTAIALHEHVGIHRNCGGLLTPGEPDTTNRHVTFYPAFCTTCRREVISCVATSRKGAA